MVSSIIKKAAIPIDELLKDIIKLFFDFWLYFGGNIQYNFLFLILLKTKKVNYTHTYHLQMKAGRYPNVKTKIYFPKPEGVFIN